MHASYSEKRNLRILSAALLFALTVACGLSIDTGAPAPTAEPAQPVVAPTVAPPTAAPPTAEPPTPEPAPAATAETAPEPTVEQFSLSPGEPPEPSRVLEDADGGLRRDEKRTLSGDAILDNRYERPFTQTAMDYEPDVDIQKAEIANDDAFYYFTIRVKGMDMGAGQFTAFYGVEFDRTQTGRGDLLVLASDPQPEWSTANVFIYADKNGTVGGLRPMVAEANMGSDGYESTLAMQGDQVAFARVDPKDPYAVQLAISRFLVKEGEFLWGAWVDKGVKDPSKFDYNDTFSPVVAGSPLKPDVDYPLKALFSVDNTCRLPYGEVKSTAVPGICKSVPKAVKPEKGGLLLRHNATWCTCRILSNLESTKLPVNKY